MSVVDLWLKLLTIQVGQFSQYLAAESTVFFYVDYSLITLPYCREKPYFFQLIFIVPSYREGRGFFWLNLFTSQDGHFSRHFAAVGALVFFFYWVKSYNSALFPWKSILISANFHDTQLPWVPWIFWLKLLTSQIDQFSRHLAAIRNVVVFAD